MEKKFLDFIQQNSPDGGFLQSVYWRRFQERYGRKTFELSEKDENDDIIIYSHIISHLLPVVGNYFYVPRGPILAQSAKLPPEARLAKGGKAQNHSAKLKTFLDELVKLAINNSAGWIRVEPNSGEELDLIKENLPDNVEARKSSVDMQPKEILILDIAKGEEELLVGMKQKTRYNIRLAEKKGVKVFVMNSDQRSVINKFLELVKITARRDRITAHPESYYRKMFEKIPPEILKLYVAEYDGKIIAANLVLFFGYTATYLHGASGNIHREVMAPYLLQWQQILDAKKAGCERYDLGGVKVENTSGKSWTGVTKFKTGFAPDTGSVKFPGCYDIVLDFKRYYLYRFLQKIKRLF